MTYAKRRGKATIAKPVFTAVKFDKQFKGKRSVRGKHLYPFSLHAALCENEDQDDDVNLDEAVLDFDDAQFPRGVT